MKSRGGDEVSGGNLQIADWKTPIVGDILTPSFW
jgi:hypothetical protein